MTATEPAAAQPGESEAELAAADLLVAVVRFGRALRGRLGDRPVDGSGNFVLHLLDGGGPQRSTDLAAAMGVDHSTVSRQVAALVEAGWVSSDPDPTDRRARRLSLTDAGRKALAAGMAERAARLAPAVDGRESDVAYVARVLGEVTDELIRTDTDTPDTDAPDDVEDHP